MVSHYPSTRASNPNPLQSNLAALNHQDANQKPDPPSSNQRKPPPPGPRGQGRAQGPAAEVEEPSAGQLHEEGPRPSEGRLPRPRHVRIGGQLFVSFMVLVGESGSFRKPISFSHCLQPKLHMPKGLSVGNSGPTGEPKKLFPGEHISTGANSQCLRVLR